MLRILSLSRVALSENPAPTHREPYHTLDKEIKSRWGCSNHEWGLVEGRGENSSKMIKQEFFEKDLFLLTAGGEL